MISLCLYAALNKELLNRFLPNLQNLNVNLAIIGRLHLNPRIIRVVSEAAGRTLLDGKPDRPDNKYPYVLMFPFLNGEVPMKLVPVPGFNIEAKGYKLESLDDCFTKMRNFSKINICS